MEAYDLPMGTAMCDGLHSLFGHYCTPFRSRIASNNRDEDAEETSMDNESFIRFVRDIPNLEGLLTRHQYDLIFSKTKPLRARRLDFEHFMKALLEVAVAIYPVDDPTSALTRFLVLYVFGLFENCVRCEGSGIFEKVFNELTSM